jgi:predicted dehydrogenase
LRLYRFDKFFIACRQFDGDTRECAALKISASVKNKLNSFRQIHAAVARAGNLNAPNGRLIAPDRNEISRFPLGDSDADKRLDSYVVINEKIVSFEALAPSKYGKVCYGSGHEPLIAHFYDCIAEGKPFPINGEEGAKVVRLILAAYRSKNNKTEISK